MTCDGDAGRDVMVKRALLDKGFQSLAGDLRTHNAGNDVRI